MTYLPDQQPAPDFSVPITPSDDSERVQTLEDALKKSEDRRKAERFYFIVSLTLFINIIGLCNAGIIVSLTTYATECAILLSLAERWNVNGVTRWARTVGAFVVDAVKKTK